MNALFIADIEKKEILGRVFRKKRNDLLYSLPSKIKEVKLLIDNLKGRTILFGNDIKSLLKITENTVSSYNTDKINTKIVNNFKDKKINTIASFKKLKQGANLNDIDNCIIMSYYSTSKDMIQRVGRLRDNGEIGQIFVFVTEKTQEEIWYTKMVEKFKNVKMIPFNGVEEYLKNK
ncbi:MAG: helicase-related protein [Senegalia sp. (in: firmicutes)]